MFAVNIALGNTVWRLLFKEEEKASDVFTALGNMETFPHAITDDYGQTIAIPFIEIKGRLLEDLDKTKMANVELFLHQQRVQTMAQKAAQSDPGLKASALMNGPSVLAPNFSRQ